MSESNEQSGFRIRATTFGVKDPKGVAGYVLKLKPEAVASLIEELSTDGYSEMGGTLFLNIYENESTYKEGETFLSTTIGAQVTEEREQQQSGGNKKAAGKQFAKTSVNNFANKVRSRSK